MRIDLIPDVRAEPAAGKRKRVVIAKPARRSTPVSGKDRQSSYYEELLQNVYDAAVITDRTGRIVDVNVRTVDFLNYTPRQLCSLSIVDIISGADGSLVKTLWKNLEDDRFSLIQAYCARKNGSLFPAEIAVNKLRLEKMHLCFFIRDITLRRQAEEMLRTEHNALHNSGSGIVVANLEGRIEYANPAMAETWECSDSGEMLGTPVTALLSDAQAAEDMIEAVMGKDRMWTGEMEAKRGDGFSFQVQISAACNRNSDGEPVGMILSFVDISDRKRAEEAEKESERRRVMLASLGAACHHLGQPSTILLANLGLIRQKLDMKDPEVKDLYDSSVQAVERLGEILHKLTHVNEFKTTAYLGESSEGREDDMRILEI